jgi:hypothetical protein
MRRRVSAVFPRPKAKKVINPMSKRGRDLKANNNDVRSEINSDIPTVLCYFKRRGALNPAYNTTVVLCYFKG